MRISFLPVSVIRPYPGAPRRHASVEKLARAIQEFGWRQPIVVDRDRVVVVGHARLAAAAQLGQTIVPVHVAEDLTPAQVRAYRIADNRLAEDAEWDDSALLAELLGLQADGVDLGSTGLDAEELERLLRAPAGLLEGIDPDDAPPLPAKPSAAHGDRYELGPHRLVCGDATDPAAWQLLMEGGRGDLLWTDPPYGVAYVGGTRAALTIQNDDLDLPALTELLRRSLSLARDHLRPGAPWYVAAPHGPPFLAFATIGHELGWWRQTLLWVKDLFALGHADYHWQHEAILSGAQEGDGTAEVFGYGWSPGAAHRYEGGRAQSTVWEIPKPRANHEHPTMKPVALIQRALVNSSLRGAMVIDCFGGSGSTLMACEVEGRVARLLELDPRYCDVIVERWEQATGRKAALS